MAARGASHLPPLRKAVEDSLCRLPKAHVPIRLARHDPHVLGDAPRQPTYGDVGIKPHTEEEVGLEDGVVLRGALLHIHKVVGGRPQLHHTAAQTLALRLHLYACTTYMFPMALRLQLKGK